MALVRELEDNGCSLRASVVCKYIRGEVQRCVACEYKNYTDEQRTEVVINHYLDEHLMEAYPFETQPAPGKCGLCAKKTPNDATTTAYAKITNKCMDVKRDMVGSGDRINGGEIDVEVPACQTCMQNLKKAKRANLITVIGCSLLVCAGTLVINLSMPTLEGIFPMITFFVCAGAGWMLYRVLQRARIQKLGQQTHLHALDLPVFVGFRKNGWYVRGESPFAPSFHDKPPAAIVDERAAEMDRRVAARKRQQRQMKQR